jgi:hypothetical protein
LGIQLFQKIAKELSYNTMMNGYLYTGSFLQPDNRDQNLMKVLSEDSTLVCGFSIPGDIPYVHKCQPGLQVLSLNTKLFSKIPTWGDYKILRPYLEFADYDYEHE